MIEAGQTIVNAAVVIEGMPNPLRLAVIANAHFDTVRLPFPPAIVQRIALALGAPVGRLAGYRPSYLPAGA